MSSPRRGGELHAPRARNEFRNALTRKQREIFIMRQDNTRTLSTYQAGGGCGMHPPAAGSGGCGPNSAVVGRSKAGSTRQPILASATAPASRLVGNLPCVPPFTATGSVTGKATTGVLDIPCHDMIGRRAQSDEGGHLMWTHRIDSIHGLATANRTFI